MIAREVCCDWQTGFAGFASEFQCFVRGGTAFFSIHHNKSFRLKSSATLEWRQRSGGFLRGGKWL
jgi:hypothetical protein